MGWIVYEVGTGFKDGMYAQKTMAEQAVANWHHRRPEHEHLLAGGYNRAIADSEWLGIQHFLSEEKGQSSI